MENERIILAIETSCDETAMSILKGNKKLLANIVSSQIDQHSLNGGVVPELASRLHLQNIDSVFKETMSKANISIEDVDGIAIVNGPGLIGALHVGVMFAKSIAYLNNIPILPIHHIAGHIYANELITDLKFPLIALVVSGGHTELVLMNNHLEFKVLGQTHDDAIGESYDKIARVLGLGYPGGPIIDKLAKSGTDIYNFPIPKNDKTYDFSYSGLKSAVINKVNTLKMKKESYNNDDIACSFQTSAIAPLISKTLMAAKEFNAVQVVLAGGVSANSYLREKITEEFKEKLPLVELVLPPLWATTDNAAMIASVASHYKKEAYTNNYSFSVNPNRKLAE
ncbi:tRNA (adenosine(37)-N6)-threonylcarbamoyltransferase complex transferase subunit TsaD [Mycoplasma sp. P36-A1]|uniref:tRNA (adenosine(37)-N6)-threonylcarbamoyltransferase complex transferase subunit TsaD n=1 Tax=Mycoplasma sp. P36-A1 TaxID=3252900 RepID=UPI003C2CAC87